MAGCTTPNSLTARSATSLLTAGATRTPLTYPLSTINQKGEARGARRAVFSPCVRRRSRRAMGQRTTILHAPSSGRKRQRVLADLGPGNPIPHQVLEEDASVVNPAISSVLRCVRGVRTSFRRGKLGELASVRPPAVPSYLSPINYQLKKEKRGTRESMINPA